MKMFLYFWINWNKLQKRLSQNTSITSQCDALTLKLVINNVTGSDRKSSRNEENDLKAPNISKHRWNVSKIVLKIQDLLATLEDNAITLGECTSEVLETSYDDCLCECCRLHIQMHEMKHNQDEDTNIKIILAELKAKHYKLVTQK